MHFALCVYGLEWGHFTKWVNFGRVYFSIIIAGIDDRNSDLNGESVYQLIIS